MDGTKFFNRRVTSQTSSIFFVLSASLADRRLAFCALYGVEREVLAVGAGKFGEGGVFSGINLSKKMLVGL